VLITLKKYTPMQNILNFHKAELENWFIERNFTKYRASQVLDAIYKQNIFDFQEMTTIPIELRNILQNEFSILEIDSYEHIISEDSTSKILCKLSNNKAVECVLIPNDKDGNFTLCLSTQEGCKLNCKFCATGKLGFISNLTSSEIITQYLLTKKLSKSKVSNIVLMGMGDPLDNFENVLKALNILINEQKQIGKNRITLSTAGFSQNIINLADSKIGVKLAFSLHSAIQIKRELIIPSANKWKLPELIKALEYYYISTKKPITFEYILFAGFNNLDEDILALKKITSRFPCKINLIQYHNIEFTGHKSELIPANLNEILEFQAKLKKYSINVFIRKSAGEDINAACGQLALNNKKSSKI